MRAFEYWASGNGLDNITPAGKAWPEGEEFPDVLREAVGDRSVVEFGCGTGRLAKIFSADRYIGVDICFAAILQARMVVQGYSFRRITEASTLPDADVTLAHTILLHIPDEDIERTAGRFRSGGVIVSEILGRKWRRSGNPPVFNREQAEYEHVFAGLGFHLEDVRELPYPHYRDTNLTLLTFAK
ncbi:MAG: class I SAM-dependent methyltransferase [Pseudolabrys sp.]